MSIITIILQSDELHDNLARKRWDERKRKKDCNQSRFLFSLDDMGGRPALIKMSTEEKESRPRQRTLRQRGETTDGR